MEYNKSPTNLSTTPKTKVSRSQDPSDYPTNISVSAADVPPVVKVPKPGITGK